MGGYYQARVGGRVVQRLSVTGNNVPILTVYRIPFGIVDQMEITPFSAVLWLLSVSASGKRLVYCDG